MRPHVVTSSDLLRGCPMMLRQAQHVSHRRLALLAHLAHFPGGKELRKNNFSG
jgi:hypothetical protein